MCLIIKGDSKAMYISFIVAAGTVLEMSNIYVGKPCFLNTKFNKYFAMNGFTPKPGREPIKMGGRRTGGQQTLGPAWTQNKMEAPKGEKIMAGGWTAAVYTPEQQSRLGINESGEKRASLSSLNPFENDTLKTLGPAYTRSNMEPPRGERNTNGYVEAFYDTEQQQRLGVDEHGKKKTKQTLGPAFTRAVMEAPKGIRNVSGGYQERYYTREQQVRLKVDEYGRHVDVVKNLMAAPPKWVTGEMEAPRGVKDMGSWNKRIYDTEQQKRLNIDEDGNKIMQQQKPQHAITRQVSFGEFDPFAPATVGLKKQLSLKGTNLFQSAVQSGTIDFDDFDNNNDDSDSDDSDSDDSNNDELKDGLFRKNTYERNLAERAELKEYRSWEKEIATEMPKEFKRDEYGNLMGSILERVTSKMVKRKWVERDFVVEKDKIILMKKGDKKGDLNVIDMDEYTCVSDISTKSQYDNGVANPFCRFKITNKTPWGQKESLLCQLGVPARNRNVLNFLHQEFMHVL